MLADGYGFGSVDVFRVGNSTVALTLLPVSQIAKWYLKKKTYHHNVVLTSLFTQLFSAGTTEFWFVLAVCADSTVIRLLGAHTTATFLEPICDP